MKQENVIRIASVLCKNKYTYIRQIHEMHAAENTRGSGIYLFVRSLTPFDSVGRRNQVLWDRVDDDHTDWPLT